ncbi:glycosyltransferase family 4 protein [Burkholderia sp. R-70006]|uniref:glycosyltransferase family 4 protein n=1 Tax=Paraburkholderia domus TaxID=2793075 RepID=UPI0019127A6C|nr:glycosyltransferase family 4 protein [Paraburkholderia domus]MBK5052535.1 glycosyltransferase family 4 protein [Burkholderia sp. R-70006]
MGPHIEALSELYDVVLVCDGVPSEVETLLSEHVSFVACPIQRNISFWRDFKCVLWLHRFLRAGEFAAVHTLMPKSGLLGMLAARLAGTKHRFHSFTGQVWATRTGVMRQVLKAMDKLLSSCASRLLTDSTSQLDFLVKQGIVSRGRIEVLADGSICGVDIRKFSRSNDARRKVRAELGIEENDIVFLFVGRLTVEKGINELLKAFSGVASRFDRAHLIIVGPSEADFQQALEEGRRLTGGRIHRIGFTPHPQEYMSAADVFCLPSYREGFGTVIIEAAAAGLPTIASRIYGITDAVEDGKTGILHQAKDVHEMEMLMNRLAQDAPLRTALGEAAHQRAVTLFSKERVVQALLDFYKKEGVGGGTAKAVAENLT